LPACRPVLDDNLSAVCLLTAGDRLQASATACGVVEYSHSMYLECVGASPCAHRFCGHAFCCAVLADISMPAFLQPTRSAPSLVVQQCTRSIGADGRHSSRHPLPRAWHVASGGHRCISVLWSLLVEAVLTESAEAESDASLCTETYAAASCMRLRATVAAGRYEQPRASSCVARLQPAHVCSPRPAALARIAPDS
jgi:hypothetical protein